MTLDSRASDSVDADLLRPDCYLIMLVIHDWDDPKAARILAGIRKAAAPGAKLRLIECIVPEDSKPSWTKMLDLQMLTLLSEKSEQRKSIRKCFEPLASAWIKRLMITLESSDLRSTNSTLCAELCQTSKSLEITYGR